MWQPKVIAVLILIILEYIYMQFSHSFSAQLTCLNPYYTGIHLHTSNGFTIEVSFTVLILIILEYIYILLRWKQKMYPQSS